MKPTNSFKFHPIKCNAPSHTREVFNVPAFRKLVPHVARDLKKLKRLLKFDAIAVSGNSGLPLAGALSYLIGVPIISVRQKGTRSVAGSGTVTGYYQGARYLIVDDLVASGGTARRIISSIEKAWGHSHCVGVYQWSSEYDFDSVMCDDSDREIPLFNRHNLALQIKNFKDDWGELDS